MEYSTRVNVPAVRDLETAVQIYYSHNELSTADIKEIFGCSGSTAVKLKRRGKEQMEKENVPVWNATCVNTEAAFRAWGLDIEKIKRNLTALRKLKLAKEKGEG